MSVVLPTRDRAQLVARAVESVLAQTYAAVEVLVIDDGSRDATTSVLERFGDRITVLSQEPAGPYAARNAGIRRARGASPVAFIDDDDVWHPDRLARQIPLIRHAGLVFGDVEHVGIDGCSLHRTSFAVTPPRRGSVVADLAWGNFVPTISVLVWRRCLEEFGLFPTSHLLGGDYLTWFRIAGRHKLDYVPGPIADYTVHDGGASADLGASLAARIELFGKERFKLTRDPARRRALQRLVFNLGLHLGLAAARGRAGSVERPWARTGEVLSAAPPRLAAAFSIGFICRQLSLRARQLAS